VEDDGAADARGRTSDSADSEIIMAVRKYPGSPSPLMTVLTCTGGLEVEVVWFVHLRKPFGRSLSKKSYWVEYMLVYVAENITQLVRRSISWLRAESLDEPP
jgi:hypothetical protein